MTLTVTDPLMLRQLLVHQKSVSLAVSTLGERGGGEARVSLDYIEARVRYRLRHP